MLTIKGLHKFYLSKEGLKHHALKGINLEFGSKGFIVLLGKSGSGKSTLLNILGGLDHFDQGEIIIKDKSTNDFKANEWDSYRNTYVGFVFQEFYIIEEYTVGKNIALALELQGFPKEKVEARVEEILKQVDLEGYSRRRPNEISGGQKQRIAIARALVKDPQIILADEPTGNLDSETGQLILDTLKNLSKEKLVIMVTHDADFAREYGDRIIELKDGEIINDQINYNQSVVKEEIYEVNKEVKSVIRLPKGKQLTQKMINYLNEVLLNEDQDLYLTLTDDKEFITSVVPDMNQNVVNESKYDVAAHLKSDSDDPFALKKASLPFKHAYALAVSSLFTRKFRLFFMTLLFILSLIFVGVSSIFSFYDISKASSLTFTNANIQLIPISKCAKELKFGNCPEIVSFTESEIQSIKQTYQDIKFLTALNINMDFSEILFENQFDRMDNPYYQVYSINKINFIDENIELTKLRFGDYSNYLNDILITDYLAEIILHQNVYDDVETMDQLIGKTLKNNFRISGITKTDYTNYDSLKTEQDYMIFYKSDFNMKREANYLQIYMTKATYDHYQNNKTFPIYPLLEPGRKGEMMVLNAAKWLTSYEDFLIPDSSEKPTSNQEIILSINQLKDILHYKNEPDSLENIKSYLTKDLTFYYEIYNETGTELVTKVYKIVGILDDTGDFLTQPYTGSKRILFTEQELNTMVNVNHPSFGGSVGITAVLGSNETENAKFIKSINQLNYLHQTAYSPVLYEIESFREILDVVLLIIGLVFAVFAALMIFTFVSTSIHSKQREIGTLRAIGARGIDVSKIFLTEGLIIAIFSSTIACILVAVTVRIVNKLITGEFETKLVFLYMSLPTVLIVYLLAIVVVILSTFIPLKRIIQMKPIKAIKNTI